jgi:hypothetical protein
VEQRIAELDEQLTIIQKSTKASLPIMVALHDIIRHKFSWYYNWHLKSYASNIHISLLIFSCIGFSSLVFSAIMPNSAAHAAQIINLP